MWFGPFHQAADHSACSISPEHHWSHQSCCRHSMNAHTCELTEALPHVDNMGPTSVTQRQGLRGITKHSVVYVPVTNQFCSESNTENQVACLKLSSTKTDPTLASLATTKQINMCSSIPTCILQLFWSCKHVRCVVYSGSGLGSRCPIFNTLPQAVIVNLAHLSFPLDIASSSLHSPVRTYPRLESSPSYSELSPLKEQDPSVLDEIEILITPSQQINHGKACSWCQQIQRWAVTHSFRREHYSKASPSFRKRLRPLSLALHQLLRSSGLIICSTLCPGLTPDSQGLTYITIPFTRRALK